MAGRPSKSVKSENTRPPCSVVLHPDPELYQDQPALNNQAAACVSPNNWQHFALSTVLQCSLGGIPEVMLDLWLMLLLLHTQHHDSLGHTYHIQHLVIHFISSNNLCHIHKQQTNLTKIQTMPQPGFRCLAFYKHHLWTIIFILSTAHIQSNVLEVSFRRVSDQAAPTLPPRPARFSVQILQRGGPASSSHGAVAFLS